MLFWAAVTAAVAALHPARAQLLALPRRADPALAGLAALAAVPAALYAAQMAANRRAGLIGDDTNGFEHWAVQAALPIALVLLVALSALKTDGWRVPAASAALGAAALGALGIADHGSRGDVATAWGVAALRWLEETPPGAPYSGPQDIEEPITHPATRASEPLGEAAIVEQGPPARHRR